MAPQLEYARIITLRAKYGLSPGAYLSMLAHQQGRCAICNCLMAEPHVDHDHTTGVTRGLLCTQCNSGLGFFKDNVRSLANAIVYLEEHGKSY